MVVLSLLVKSALGNRLLEGTIRRMFLGCFLLEVGEESWLFLEELPSGLFGAWRLLEGGDVGAFIEVARVSGFAVRTLAGIFVGRVGEERLLLEEAQQAVVVVAAHTC